MFQKKSQSKPRYVAHTKGTSQIQADIQFIELTLFLFLPNHTTDERETLQVNIYNYIVWFFWNFFVIVEMAKSIEGVGTENLKKTSHGKL
jgi:hypothetical protein